MNKWIKIVRGIERITRRKGGKGWGVGGGREITRGDLILVECVWPRTSLHYCHPHVVLLSKDIKDEMAATSRNDTRSPMCALIVRHIRRVETRSRLETPGGTSSRAKLRRIQQRYYSHPSPFSRMVRRWRRGWRRGNGDRIEWCWGRWGI